MSAKKISRRGMLKGLGMTVAGTAFAACQPQTVVVEKEVEKEVTRVVKETVKETVVVEGTPQVVEKEVVKTVIVERTVAPPEPVTISLISWWNKPYRDLLPRFRDKNPDIDVEFIDSGSGYNEKVMTALASGSELSDIAGCNDENLRLWADTGGVADISELMAPYEDKIVPYKLQLGKYQGKNYGVPWDGSPCLLYYRRDVCEEYGIDPEAIETYDDWLVVGRQLVGLSDDENRLWGLNKGTWPFINWAWQRGSGLYNLDETQVIIDSPECVETLEFLKTLWDSGTIHQNMEWGPQMASYKDGSSAIFPGAIWLANFIKGNAPETAGKWGVAPLPAWVQGGSRAYTSGGSQLVILGSSQHKEEAFKFLEYTQLTQEGQEVLWTSGDLFPVLIEAVDWPIMNEPVDWYGGQPALRMYAEVNSQVTPYTIGVGWVEASEIVVQEMGQALDGDKLPEQALADAAKEIRDRQQLG